MAAAKADVSSYAKTFAASARKKKDEEQMAADKDRKLKQWEQFA